ncbi:hypothetical protein [uncultured Psychroserpens sp.]|uniref:hypothetical protein n=1 Tax=uncultured Psychroserpens sp. TaxID=255436 RepID=UPI00260D1462|nr:hypothetical protein [uncultured Psychroserpens sp.]
MHHFKLKFSPEDLSSYAKRYDYRTDVILDNVVISSKGKGFLTKSDFLKICEWKTPRSKPLCASNSEEFIREITFIALKTKTDQLRIEILTLLKGVSWPTASVILHFCHDLEFPIIDFRALYSLGYDEVPNYNYIFWKNYTDYCRGLGSKLNLDLRTIDMGLWQYSKEKQNE